MPFTPGQSGNPKGEPKGSENKTNRQLRSLISVFLSDKFHDVEAAFKKLSPRDKVKAYTDLLQYGLAKLQNVSIKADLEKFLHEATAGGQISEADLSRLAALIAEHLKNANEE